MMMNRNLRLNLVLDQTVEENRPPFFSKKMGVCFLQLFDPSTPKASKHDPMAHNYFMHNHSYKNSFKQCKISYKLIKFFCTYLGIQGINRIRR